MRTSILAGAFAALLLVCSSCSAPDSTSAPVPKIPPVVSAPVAPQNFPPLDGPSRTFVFDHGFWNVMGYTANSRFVLYDNHAFVLHYPGLDYRGGYSGLSGGIDFKWEGWSTAGPWGAIGTLVGDTLTVRYNLVMALSDFEDGVYVLQQ